jgi:hypothetical protein
VLSVFSTFWPFSRFSGHPGDAIALRANFSLEKYAGSMSVSIEAL